MLCSKICNWNVILWSPRPTVMVTHAKIIFGGEYRYVCCAVCVCSFLRVMNRKPSVMAFVKQQFTVFLSRLIWGPITRPSGGFTVKSQCVSESLFFSLSLSLSHSPFHSLIATATIARKHWKHSTLEQHCLKSQNVFSVHSMMPVCWDVSWILSAVLCVRGNEGKEFKLLVVIFSSSFEEKHIFWGFQNWIIGENWWMSLRRVKKFCRKEGK
jgi:hypothetical protein